MSWAFITALKKKPQQSYVQLLNSIRDELATRYSQKPQLSCSHPLSKDPDSDPDPLGLASEPRNLLLTHSRRHEPPLCDVDWPGLSDHLTWYFLIPTVACADF